MANTIKITNRTIEISDIDSDYMMGQKINVQSVVLLPGATLKASNYVDIIENSVEAVDPVKVRLFSSIGEVEPRVWIFNQRLQLGFVFANAELGLSSKVIFNIGEIHRGNDAINTRMLMKLSAEDAVL